MKTLTFMKLLKIVMLSLIVVILFSQNIVFCGDENCIDINFDIFIGSGKEEYYVGDHFWYNITILNSGVKTIDALFTVKVLNITGGIVPTVRNYEIFLLPNGTTNLYPSYTRNGKEEVNVYFFEKPGTYTIEVTSNIYLIYYRYYSTARYTVEHNSCKYIFDVMPSYEKVQNERWNKFLQKNENYMMAVENYIGQSRIESLRTRNIAFLSIFVSISSMIIRWIGLPGETRRQHRYLYLFILIFTLVFLVIISL